ncbi:MAG: alcohol dehydrogenase catalytic domain-containing protein [Sulfolobales archaeon]|nr:alcohol dehydrogenase catalytic domain-containing protein [Sulfolobales archaeon]MCX8186111.1 alcohol dehydrogenase catalytic domain-containing protein [Sulfolobales archaeon]MDW7969406.1 alcohol dehydrogenase catalytic domain-containing protein [Sulfolobales archaeon]
MEGKMRALIIRKPKDLSVEEVPIPKIKEDEILVKVNSVGICGSDIEIKNGSYPDYIAYPIIPGHETAGTVVEVGSNVLGLKVGDRVAIEPHGGCGQCRNCKIGYYSYCVNYGKPGHRTLGFTVNGGFAEYVAAPARNAHELPNGMSFEEGAMAVSAGTSMFGIMEIGLDPGETVVIIGPGPIGLTSLSIAKALGAGTTVMVGTRWARLNLAKELGADVLVNVKEGQDPVKVAMEVSDGLGVDLVINTTPSAESVLQSVKMLRRGGRLLMLGITWEPTPLVLGEIVTKGLTIKGTRGEARNALERVIKLASSGKIDLKKIITNVFPLSDVIEAFEVFEKRIGDPIKVVVKP